jgi:deoxyribonuclease-4
MWRSGMPDSQDVRRLQQIRDKHDLRPMVIHANYLINLASVHPAIRVQSIAAFRREIERAILIGADHLVVHPGNYKDQTLEEGLHAVIQAIAGASQGLESDRLSILLENTAGCGAQLGSRFEELAVLRQLAQERSPIRIGFCIDTAHCLASGNYDVSTAPGLKATVAAAELVLGLDHICVIHTNDSKVPLGSRVDRHQHIGQGYIGIEGFRRILTHPKLRSKAFILETPADEFGDERSNLETLKSLCRKSSTTIKKSS